MTQIMSRRSLTTYRQGWTRSFLKTKRSISNDPIFFKNQKIVLKRSDLFLKTKRSISKDRIFWNSKLKKIGSFCEISDILKRSDILKKIGHSEKIGSFKVSEKTFSWDPNCWWTGVHRPISCRIFRWFLYRWVLTFDCI